MSSMSPVQLDLPSAANINFDVNLEFDKLMNNAVKAAPEKDDNVTTEHMNSFKKHFKLDPTSDYTKRQINNFMKTLTSSVINKVNYSSSPHFKRLQNFLGQESRDKSPVWNFSTTEHIDRRANNEKQRTFSLAKKT